MEPFISIAAGSILGFLTGLFFYLRADRVAKKTQKALEDKIENMTSELTMSTQTINDFNKSLNENASDSKEIMSTSDLKMEQSQLSALLDLVEEKRDQEKRIYGKPSAETIAEIARLKFELNRIKFELAKREAKDQLEKE